MEQARALYREGRLTESIASLQAWLRDAPDDRRARSFLFELLCFAGEFDRARTQLTLLAEDSNETRLGVAFYLAALTAETERQAWYKANAIVAAPAEPEALAVCGACNGNVFRGIQDLDPRLGENLEFLAAGRYHRIAFHNLARVEFFPPRKVRDLYWRLATVQLSPDMDSTELDSILVPVLYPQSFLFEDDVTRLGRATDFIASGSDLEIPYGQRIIAFGESQIPILEIESIEFESRTAFGV